ncbi:MAG: RecX family transcriptional regulator [Flavobacteriaceae bacterium]|nr:RecX family transcriptional regulator [Flavobacteriaceae bacterium]
MNEKYYSVEDAKRLLEGYCVYQERCHKEVLQKLYDIGMQDLAREDIIIHLLQHDFLNEERFAKSFVDGKFRLKKWGRMKIIGALKFKDVSQYNIDSGLEEIEEDDYLVTLNELANMKIDTLKESNIFKKKQKIIQFLYGKGYESPLIYDCLNDLMG